MTQSKDFQEPEDGPDALQIAQYLWEEYRYRHDLVWQLVFRVTTVATILLIVPFLINDSIRDTVGNWIVLSPLLAILVIVIGYYVMQSELGLLKKIKSAYRSVQNDALRDTAQWEPHPLPSRDEPTVGQILTQIGFEERVSLFMLLILVAAIIFFVLFLVAWQPT